MIEITSPNSLGIQNILINGIIRFIVQPLPMRAAAQALYGQDVEYAVRPAAAKMSGESFHLNVSDAIGRAIDDGVRLYA